jgi:response regulator NasT
MENPEIMSASVRVLIVEDEFLISLFLSQQLENLGYAVVATAKDGAAGVAEALRLKPDVVLMDVGLPVMDGIEASRQILAAYPVPIIMLSAYDDDKKFEEAQAAGVAGYVIKPATERQLQEAIEQALNQSKADTA